MEDYAQREISALTIQKANGYNSLIMMTCLTRIKFDLPKPENVKIQVFNTLGQKISTILDKPMIAGHHEVEFNAKNLSSGIYFYRIEAGEFQDVKKMVVLK